MFLASYENKLDKKGRVSVPASYRSYLSNLGYNGVICYPSFNHQSIEAWPQDRIEKFQIQLTHLILLRKKEIILQLQYYLKVLIYSLIVREEFHSLQNY